MAGGPHLTSSSPLLTSLSRSTRRRNSTRRFFVRSLGSLSLLPCSLSQALFRAHQVTEDPTGRDLARVERQQSRPQPARDTTPPARRPGFPASAQQRPAHPTGLTSRPAATPPDQDPDRRSTVRFSFANGVYCRHYFPPLINAINGRLKTLSRRSLPSAPLSLPPILYKIRCRAPLFFLP
jgi:hypothetical protein